MSYYNLDAVKWKKEAAVTECFLGAAVNIWVDTGLITNTFIFIICKFIL